MKTAIGWIAAITLVGSTIQARAEAILLKCDDKNGVMYFDINDSRVIVNGERLVSVVQSTITISAHDISFEQVAGGMMRSVWRIDRSTGQYSLEVYLSGQLTGKRVTGSCEKDTRPSLKF
jgi:hypothetical protein